MNLKCNICSNFLFCVELINLVDLYDAILINYFVLSLEISFSSLVRSFSFLFFFILAQRSPPSPKKKHNKIYYCFGDLYTFTPSMIFVEFVLKISMHRVSQTHCNKNKIFFSKIASKPNSIENEFYVSAYVMIFVNVPLQPSYTIHTFFWLVNFHRVLCS